MTARTLLILLLAMICIPVDLKSTSADEPDRLAPFTDALRPLDDVRPVDTSPIDPEARQTEQLDRLIMAPPPCYGDSLRIVTYNTAFLATGDSNEDVMVMEDEERAREIARGILKEEHDIVVLQEVFADDAKTELARALRFTYPYIVMKLDAADLDQDSGLMLFSRYPFAPLPNPQYRADDVWAVVDAANNPTLFYDVAFVEYDDCLHHDCWANKGFGLVRIQIPCTGSFVNVGFTHLQASYDGVRVAIDGWSGTRSDQLNDVRRVIEGTLTPSQRKTEQIYVVGDLNINGNSATARNLAVPSPPRSEWSDKFDPTVNPIGFFASELIDSWYFETSPDDVGQTSDGESAPGFPYFEEGPTRGERLDYILHNDFSESGADRYTQHLTKVWDIPWYLSDHLAIRTDVNRWSPHCGPRIAAVKDPQPDAWHSGEIRYPGSMQWVRLDEPGAYSIQVYQTGVTSSYQACPGGSGELQYAVYESTDLSRPLNDYHGEITEWGRKFVVPEAPFYIRVFSGKRCWTGTYELDIHRHSGASPEDAITLLPAVTESYKMPAQPLNSENAVWFDFRTEVSDKGVYPQVAFMLDHWIWSSFRFELIQARNGSFHTLGYSNPWGLWWWVVRQGHTRADLDAGKYYLKVLPQMASSAGHEFNIRWETELAFFVPLSLKCLVQDDTFGDDEINFQLDSDLSTLPPNWTGELNIISTPWTSLGDFDEGTLKDIYPTMKVRSFVKNVLVWLLEDDSGLNGAPDYWGWRAVSTFDPTELRAPFELEWKTSSYHYRLRGLLIRDRSLLRAVPYGGVGKKTFN